MSEKEKLNNYVRISFSVIATAALILIPEAAAAAAAGTGASLNSNGTNNLASVFTNLIKVLQPAATFITGASYVAGVGFGISALLGFKNHSEQPQQVPIKQPMIKAVVAVCLVYFGYFLQNSAGTIFGTGATSTGVGGF